MVVERNIKNAVEETNKRWVNMEDIYLNKEKLKEIKEVVRELGVSL